MNSTQTFTIIDVVMAVFRSPIKFTFWFIVFFALVVLAYLVVPRSYSSDGKLFVQVGRSSVGAGPTTSAGTISLQDSRATEVKSVVDLLGSRKLAAKVVDIVGVERILKPNSAIGRFIEDLPEFELGSMEIEDDETELSGEEIDAINRRNEAIKSLMSDLSLGHEKNTTVVSVSVKSQTPFLAKDIVQAYLDEYQKVHVDINAPQGGGFYDEQLTIYKTALVDSEKKIEQFRSGLNVLDVKSARELLQKEIDQLRLDALTTAVKLSEAKEKSFKIQNSYSQVPEFVVGVDTTTSSLARDKARESLYNLQLEESEMASKYNAGNPKLVAIQNTIKGAKRQLKAIPKTFKEAERQMNPARKEILVLLTEASAESDGFQKRLQATETLIGMKVSEVNRLNRLALEEAALMREAEINKKTMLIMADKSAESATIDALDSESISNVAVAQMASLIPKKVFPSGLMFGVIGGALSALLATMMTFLKDFRVGYEIDRQNRQAHLGQRNGRRRARTRTRRPRREPAMARSGAVREDFQPSELASTNYADGSYADDEEYRQENYRDQRPLHQELQDPTDPGRNGSHDATELDPSGPSRSRSAEQVNVIALVAGFSILVVAYLFVFVFST